MTYLKKLNISMIVLRILCQAIYAMDSNSSDAFYLNSNSINAVKLVSQDGSSLLLPTSVVDLSPFLHYVRIEKPGCALCIPDTSGVYLNLFGACMLALYKVPKNYLQEFIFDAAQTAIRNVQVPKLDSSIWPITVSLGAPYILLDHLNIKHSIKLLLMSDFLEIKPLVNIFAYIIASKLSLVTRHHIIEKWLSDLPYRLLWYIEKHFFLRQAGYQELNIADYISTHDHKIINETLQVSNKRITSLYGLNQLAGIATVKYMYLNNNFITDYDVQEVSQPFINCAQLVKLTLAHNQLGMIKPHYFQGLSQLQYIDLRGKTYSFSERDIYESLPSLKDIIMLKTHLD